MRIILTCALLIYWRPVEASSLKIDNSLIEPPRLECLADSISIHIQTKQPFFGRIFVKGQSHLPECSTRGNESTDGSPNHKALHLLFENCFLRRQRVFSPRRGVTVSTIIVVSFHPFFLTGSDGAYRLQCIYLDSKQSLSAVLNVKDTTLAAANSLPTCKYEILEGGFNGRPISLASVGTKVYHLWTCQAQEPNKYCALIHSCVAEDGNGVQVQILDEQGCSRDNVLLQNLEYLDDLRAGQSTVVCKNNNRRHKHHNLDKFADKESIFFKCEIMITQKKEGRRCPRPICPPNVGSVHFESAPRNSSTLVAFDRRVLALRRVLLKRRIRESTSIDVLSELSVLEMIPVVEEESSDSLVSRCASKTVKYMSLSWLIYKFIRFL